MAFLPYDPSWLVELAKAQFPNDSWLHEALIACTHAEPIPDDPDEGVYFIDRMEGEFWQNVILVHPEKGRIILDILKDKRVGAMSMVEIPNFTLN
jgi:hypothetical protein